LRHKLNININDIMSKWNIYVKCIFKLICHLKSIYQLFIYILLDILNNNIKNMQTQNNLE
jgi:hypothetical protein